MIPATWFYTLYAVVAGWALWALLVRRERTDAGLKRRG